MEVIFAGAIHVRRSKASPPRVRKACRSDRSEDGRAGCENTSPQARRSTLLPFLGLVIFTQSKVNGSRATSSAEPWPRLPYPRTTSTYFPGPSRNGGISNRTAFLKLPLLTHSVKIQRYRTHFRAHMYTEESRHRVGQAIRPYSTRQRWRSRST